MGKSIVYVTSEIRRLRKQIVEFPVLKRDCAVRSLWLAGVQVDTCIDFRLVAGLCRKTSQNLKILLANADTAENQPS